VDQRVVNIVKGESNFEFDFARGRFTHITIIRTTGCCNRKSPGEITCQITASEEAKDYMVTTQSWAATPQGLADAHSLNQLLPSEMKRSILYGVEFDIDPGACPEIV
jgi:hypothetical protein